MGKTGVVAPTGSLITINGKQVGYLAEDLQISLSSQFTDLISWRPPAFFTAAVNTVNNVTGTKLPTGSFEQFGLQIWESTAPISISFQVDLYLGMTVNGNVISQDDMIKLAKTLLKLPLPYKEKNAIGLFPPGPDLTALFASGDILKVKSTGAGISSIVFSNGVSLNKAVVKSVQPTVSRYATGVAGKERPIYIKLSIEAQGIFSATQNEIEGWWS